MKKSIILLIPFFFNDPHFEYRQLTWSDFRGVKKDSGQIRAIAATEIETSEIQNTSGRLFFTATAYFDPENSYTLTNDPESLQHEQLHFQISQVFALRITKEASRQRGWSQTDRWIGRKIVKDLLKLWGKTENQYDEETNHGNNRAQQERWNRTIESWLKNY